MNRNPHVNPDALPHDLLRVKKHAINRHLAELSV